MSGPWFTGDASALAAAIVRAEVSAEFDVPPTLVSFATAIGSVDRATSPEFKQAGSRVVRIAPASYDGFWANFGADYGYFPLIQPILGLAWLFHRETRAAYELGVRD